jgi:tectonic-1/3
VLVGRMQMTATKRAITERPGGLKLFGASADGSCSTSSATPVAFNEDVRVGCTKKLDYAGLKALCETSQQNRVPIQLNVTDDYVGTLGNSDPHFVEEWLKIGGKWDDALGSLPTFTSETGVCKGLITGLEYRVLYANIGANTNPQRKVVAVTASYKLGTWQFMLENLVRVASTFARRAQLERSLLANARRHF